MTLNEGNLWYKSEVIVAMVTKLCTHSFLQWYETHTMLCNGMKCIPVLILKSQRHTFSQTNNFSQINKFFVYMDNPEDFWKVWLKHSETVKPLSSVFSIIVLKDLLSSLIFGRFWRLNQVYPVTILPSTWKFRFWRLNQVYTVTILPIGCKLNI